MNPPWSPRPEVLDALLEIVNIGIGRAAGGLSELTGREVGLSVPSLDFDFLRTPAGPGGIQPGTTLRVSQGFSGDFGGHAALVLNEQGAGRIAELLLGQRSGQELFDEIEQGALLELGNIIIGGVVGNVVNHLDQEVQYQLPRLQLRGIDAHVDLVSDLTDTTDARVLVLRTSLSIARDNVSGHLLLVFGEAELHQLVRKLEELLDRM